MPPLGELNLNAAIRAAEKVKKATEDLQRTVDLTSADLPLGHYPTNVFKGYGTMPPVITLSPHGSTNTSTIRPISFPHDTIVDDESDEGMEIKYNCNQIRNRINTFINNGGMKVGEFQEKLGVSSRSYLSFMRQNGPHAGCGTDTYPAAHKFFVDRERAGLKMPRAKKATKAVEEKFAADTPDMPKLDGEDTGTVPVFDTCDDVRKKISAHLRRDGITQAAFARELSKCCAPSDTAGMSSKNVTDFSRKKGVMAGNTSKTFYAAYVYFEKLRLSENKPKSKKRLEMEQEHGGEGVTRDRDMGNNMRMLGTSDESFCVNKYGKVEIYRNGSLIHVS